MWTYTDPLPDAAELDGHPAFFDEAFFDELVDVAVDGVPRPPVTPWS